MIRPYRDQILVNWQELLKRKNNSIQKHFYQASNYKDPTQVRQKLVDEGPICEVVAGLLVADDEQKQARAHEGDDDVGGLEDVGTLRGRWQAC